MQSPARPRTILLPRRAVVSFLVFVVVAFLSLPALADHIGPHRTVSSFAWERLACHYEAVYDPPGPGFFGCTLDLYEPPDGSCTAEGSVASFFNPGSCSGWPGSCTTLPCDISLDDSTESCSEGQQGCRAVEKTVDIAPAEVGGSVTCGVTGSGGWCRGGAELSLSGSEPLSGYSILSLEGTRNGEPFACSGAACGVPLLEGNNAFTFWARSTYGDTSFAGSAGGKLDSTAPSISGGLSGSLGEAGWYVSNVTVTASASDPALGSGLANLEVSVDGSGWGPYSGPLVLSDGEHTADLRAADGAGNSAQESLVVRVDTQPPEIDLSAAASFCPGCGQTQDIELSVQDSGSGIVEWTLTADGVLVASGSGPGGQTLGWNGSGVGGGSHTLTLEARDAAGNTVAVSESFDLILPTAAPEPPTEDASSGLAPQSTTAGTTATATTSPGATPSPALHPTRTPLTIPFGALPAVPQALPGEGPSPNGLVSPQREPASSGSTDSSGPHFGAAALALIATATAFTLDRLRRREEEEAALRQEMERRNKAAQEREDTERAALAAAIAAAAAAAELARQRSEAAAQRDRIGELRAEAEMAQTVGDPEPLKPSVAEGVQLDRRAVESQGSDRDQAAHPHDYSTVPDALVDFFPSFEFTPHSTEEPLFRLGIVEGGAFESWRAGIGLNPVVGLASEKFFIPLPGVRISVGWEGNSVGLSFQTPPTVHDLGEGGTALHLRNTGSMTLTWDGWNTRFDARYSPQTFSVTNQGTVGYTGSGSQGIYFKEKPVEGLALVGLGVAVLWGLATMNPQVAGWIERAGQLLAPGRLTPAFP